MLFELNPQPMWVYSVDSYQIRNVNQAAINHYGYSREEFLKLTIKDIRPAKDVPMIESLVQKLQGHDQLFSKGISQHIKKDGEVIDVQIQSSIVFIDGEKSELVLVTDITEFLASEKEKALADARLQEAQKIARIGYWSRNLDENVSEWSDLMYEICGQDPATFIPTNENLLSCFHPEDRYMLMEEAYSALKLDEDNDIKHRIITSTGEVRWVFQRLQLKQDSSGKLVSLQGVTQDITEITKAGEKFKAIFDNTSDAIIIGDDDGKCLDFNGAAVALFGYSHQDLNRLNFNDLLRQPETEPGLNLWQKIIGDRNGHGCIDLLKSDNTVISTFFNAKPTILPGINVLILTDISEQVTRRKLLVASERRFKALVQEGADMIGIIDKEGYYKFVAESSFAILGIHPDDFIGKNAFDLVHPDDRAGLQTLFSNLTDLKQIKTPPFRFLDGSGNYRWIVTIATDLSNDPALDGIVVNSRDISDEVLRSDELKLSNERYKIIMKAANEAIYDWDIVHDMVEWGTGFQDVFGYKLEVYNNNLWTDNIFSEDKARVIAELNDAVADTQKDMMLSECRFYNADRNLLFVEYRIIFLRNKNGVAIRAIGSLRDITAYKKNLHKVTVQNEKLKEIAWAQSHMVRAPLSRMMGIVDLIKNYENSEAESKTLLEHLLCSAQEFDVIIREISNKTNQVDLYKM